MRYLAIREPIRQMREFDSFSDGFFDDFRKSLSLFDSAFTGSDLEIKEEKDKFVLLGDLEGYKKKDIKVTVDDNVLYVKAEKKNDDKKTKETSYSSFSRVLYLGENVDQENIKASFTKGKLSVTIPKLKEIKNKVTEVTVE